MLDKALTFKEKLFSLELGVTFLRLDVKCKLGLIYPIVGIKKNKTELFPSL